MALIDVLDLQRLNQDLSPGQPLVITRSFKQEHAHGVKLESSRSGLSSKMKYPVLYIAECNGVRDMFFIVEHIRRKSLLLGQ